MKRIPTCHERRLEVFNPIKIIQLSRKPAVAPAKGNGLRGLSISKLHAIEVKFCSLFTSAEDGK